MMMRHTIRAGAAVAAVGLLAAGLTGCGGGSGAAADGGTAENPVELRFRWWGGDARQAIQLKAIALFEEQNPDIRITPEPTSFDGFYDSLGVEMAGRNAPDVFTLDRAWPIEYGGRGGLLDLMTLDSLDMTPFPASALTNATIGEQVFGVSTGANATGLMVNMEVVEAAGLDLPDDDAWTWADFSEFATAISENTPDGTFGIELRPHAFLQAYANQRDGIGLFDADGNVNVSEDTIADFFQLHLDLQESGAAASAALTSELMQAGPEEQLFGQGLAAMTFTPSNGITASGTVLGHENIQLLRIPGETEFATPGATVLASMFFAVGADTDHPEEAARFVDFMVNDPGVAEIMTVDRGVPVNQDIANHIKDSLAPLETAQVEFMERVTEHAVPGPSLPAGAGEFEAITFRTLDEAMFGRLSVTDAAASWTTQMQTALDSAS